MIGFLGAFIAIELQAAFLPIYFVNNPEYESIEIPFGSVTQCDISFQDHF